MSKLFMPELPVKDRVMILQQNADRVEETTYQKPLNEEEISMRKDILVNNSTQIYDLEEEKKESVKVFKEKLDPMKNENKRILSELRTGQASVSGTLYFMANHEDNMMETYDHEGELVGSRRLYPNERQGTLSFLKNGTHN